MAAAAAGTGEEAQAAAVSVLAGNVVMDTEPWTESQDTSGSPPLLLAV